MVIAFFVFHYANTLSKHLEGPVKAQCVIFPPPPPFHVPIQTPIVSITINQSHTEEKWRENEFWALQDEVLNSWKIITWTTKLSVHTYFLFHFWMRQCLYLALSGLQCYPNLSHFGMANPKSSYSQNLFSRYCQISILYCIPWVPFFEVQVV